MIESKDVRSRRNSLRLAGFDYAASRVYSVTIVTSNRRRVFLDDRLATMVIECMLESRLRLGFRIYCYCLMPDHLHVLIGTSKSGKRLGEIIGAFKSVSTRAHWQWYEGRLWQRQYFDHIIRSDRDLGETWAYILQNPTRKGLVDWPYLGAFHGPAY